MGNMEGKGVGRGRGLPSGREGSLITYCRIVGKGYVAQVGDSHQLRGIGRGKLNQNREVPLPYPIKMKNF
jgi:hypothetical protein